MGHCSLMSMGTPLFYFKIKVLIWQILSGQSLNENLLSLLFLRNYLDSSLENSSLNWRRSFMIWSSRAYQATQFSSWPSAAYQATRFSSWPSAAYQVTTPLSFWLYTAYEATLLISLLSTPYQANRQSSWLSMAVKDNRFISWPSAAYEPAHFSS